MCRKRSFIAVASDTSRFASLVADESYIVGWGTDVSKSTKSKEACEQAAIYLGLSWTTYDMPSRSDLPLGCSYHLDSKSLHYNMVEPTISLSFVFGVFKFDPGRDNTCTEV